MGDARVPEGGDGESVVFPEKENSAVLHWDVKKLIPLLAVMALAVIALVLGFADSFCGIYW
jgi:hypothetical protein